MSKLRDLYDPNRKVWYRGVAEHVSSYYDQSRSQWVTVALGACADPWHAGQCPHCGEERLNG